jgi:type IV pilus assembly protein PilM
MRLFANILKDPPPTHAFELSEEGIAFARIAQPALVEFTSLEPGVLVPSPAHENFQQPHVLQESIRSIAPPNGRRRAALILPDYCARIAVLDFDAFPDDHEEQRALIRFRMKKSVPFDVDAAAVSFVMQNRPRHAGQAKVEVVTALMSSEIVGRYEAPFRALGFQPGLVTISSLAALNLIEPDAVTMLVKLSGRILSVLVLEGSVLKLTRCIEMDGIGIEDIESVLHPTMAYVEDELKAPAKRLRLCGFGAQTPQLAQRWMSEWGVAIEPLQSRYGTPTANNAGLLGYLESVSG